MFSRRDAECRESDKRCYSKYPPRSLHLRSACLPELFRQQHDDHQKACVTAENQISAVQSVTEHGALVDKDVFDGRGRVVGRSRPAVRRRTWKQRPPPHKSLKEKRESKKRTLQRIMILEILPKSAHILFRTAGCRNRDRSTQIMMYPTKMQSEVSAY